METAIYRKDVQIAAPAAGQPISYRIPAGVQGHVASVAFTFTTDANVANRFPFVTYSNANGDELFIVRSYTAQTATLQYRYSFFAGAFQTGTPGSRPILALPCNFPITGDDLITIDISGVQAGDAMTGINLTMMSAVPFPP